MMSRESKAAGGRSSKFLTQSCVGSRPMEPFLVDALKAGQVKTPPPKKCSPCSCGPSTRLTPPRAGRGIAAWRHRQAYSGGKVEGMNDLWPLIEIVSSSNNVGDGKVRMQDGQVLMGHGIRSTYIL